MRNFRLFVYIVQYESLIYPFIHDNEALLFNNNVNVTDIRCLLKLQSGQYRLVYAREITRGLPRTCLSRDISPRCMFFLGVLYTFFYNLPY